MAKFCGKCGAKLDDVTGYCPNCDAEKYVQPIVSNDTESGVEDSYVEIKPSNNGFKKASKKQQKIQNKADKKMQKVQKKANRTLGQKFKSFLVKFLIILLVLSILAGGVTTLLAYFHWVEVPVISDWIGKIQSDDGNNEEQYMVTTPDVDEYYENNSKVVSKIDINDSKNVTTEADTITLLKNRGFEDIQITTNYNMDGEYFDDEEIAQSTTKHPIYQTYYQTENGEIWTIFVINGTVTANPVIYNMQSELNAQVVIAETDTVVSYDSTTNQFYETIPNESELILKKVSAINAKTLESLTGEEIDAL